MRRSVNEIIRKTIKAVVISEDNRIGPQNQVFLVFDDGTYFEFYGDIRCAGRVDAGSEECAINYARKAAGRITIFGQPQAFTQ